MARDVIALGEHLGLAEYALCAFGVGSELTSRVVNLGAPVIRAVMCGWGGPPADLFDQYASEEWVHQAEHLAEGFEADEPDTIADRQARAWRDAADRSGVEGLALAARLRRATAPSPDSTPAGSTFPCWPFAAPTMPVRTRSPRRCRRRPPWWWEAGIPPPVGIRRWRGAAVEFLAKDRAPPVP